MKKDNASFDNFMQQDAHEFFNFLVNSLSDILQSEAKAAFPHDLQSQSAIKGVKNKNRNHSNNNFINDENNQKAEGRLQSDAPLAARCWKLPPSKSEGRQTSVGTSATSTPLSRPPSTTPSSTAEKPLSAASTTTPESRWQ